MSLGLSRFGPYDTPILLSFNNRRVDMLAVRQLAAWNPQRAAEQMRSLDQFKDVSATVRDPAFRSAEILIVPAEAFATIQALQLPKRLWPTYGSVRLPITASS